MCTAAPLAVPLGLSWDDRRGGDGGVGGMVKRPCHYFTYRPTSSSTSFALHFPIYIQCKWRSLLFIDAIQTISTGTAELYIVHLYTWVNEKTHPGLVITLPHLPHLSLEAVPLPLVPSAGMSAIAPSLASSKTPLPCMMHVGYGPREQAPGQRYCPVKPGRNEVNNAVKGVRHQWWFKVTDHPNVQLISAGLVACGWPAHQSTVANLSWYRFLLSLHWKCLNAGATRQCDEMKQMSLCSYKFTEARHSIDATSYMHMLTCSLTSNVSGCNCAKLCKTVQNCAKLCKTVQNCAKQQCCAQCEWNALQRI